MQRMNEKNASAEHEFTWWVDAKVRKTQMTCTQNRLDFC